jgi:MEMO1 family protein
MAVARQRDLEVRLLDRRTSGDTAGDSQRVVGYASFALYCRD